MDQERYSVVRSEDEFTYWFYSEGPRGRILKAVQFQYAPKLGRNAFNLAFGDWNESSGRLNDQVISNNGDHLKVLYTVAITVLNFINFYPRAIIWVKGSSSSRTRLYQMGIASFLFEINKEFEILGKVGRNWTIFKKGVNYEEFLLFKKIK